MQINKFLTIIFISVAFAALTNAQSYKVEKTDIFQPNIPDQNKKILLLQDNSDPQRKLILFKTPLAVNTDGSPTSYNPQDPKGETKAINTVCNAIAVYKTSEVNGKSLCSGRYSEAIGVFEKWRDSGYLKVPEGYRISWENDLAKTTDNNGNKVPCIFKSEEYKDYRGFFGSLTARKNDLPLNERGECEAKNQLDALHLPHLVLAGGANPVRAFGAIVGDLVVAFNPKNNQMSFAIIGDTGPANNLGEGSVFMNMTLLGKTTPPKTKKEIYRDYTIGGKGILIAIIPASANYKIQKPFTAENIADRIKQWQQSVGFTTPESFIQMMKSFQSKL